MKRKFECSARAETNIHIGNLSSERGFALVLTIIITMLLFNMIGAGLMVSGLNSKTASNYKTGTTAMQVADAGVQHALSMIPVGTEFDSLLTGNISGLSCPGTCDGVAVKPTLTGTLSNLTGYAYTVVAEDDQDDPLSPAPMQDANGRVLLVSTALGPNGGKKTIQAHIGRSTGAWTPPATLYSPGGPGSDAAFNTAPGFFISGKDTNYSDLDLDGRADSASPGPKAPVYGVATNNEFMTNEFINSLTNSQKTRVQGKGYRSPTPAATAFPSVFTTNSSFSVSSLVDTLKEHPSTVKYLGGLSRTATDCPTPLPTPAPAGCVLGTDASPQITYIKQDSGAARFDTGSTVTGSGVLIIEGNANLFGNFEFHGLVISLAAGPRGAEGADAGIKFKLMDNARIFGGLILGPNDDQLKFDIKGNASVFYSSQALSLVENHWGSLLPKPAVLLAWREVMD